jgi:hypothetical protein
MLVGIEADSQLVFTLGQTGDVIPSAIEAGNFAAIQEQMSVSFGRFALSIDSFRRKRKILQLQLHIPTRDRIRWARAIGATHKLPTKTRELKIDRIIFLSQ